jgi:activator of HSP90 ATPase
MTAISEAVIADQLVTRHAVALSSVKNNIETQQKSADIIEEAAFDVPVSETLGANVDITA